jgi:TrmH family RNA methyltransferase
MNSAEAPSGGSGGVRRVESAANPLVKLIAGLRLKKNRDELGLFLAEGARTGLEALECGFSPRYLIYTPVVAQREATQRLREACLKAGGTCLEVNDAIITKITRKENPQSLIAAFPIKIGDAESIKPENGALYVALDRIRDPGNLGTITRTADCVRAAGLILIGDCCDPFSVEAVRASMGSIFNVPIFRCTEEAFVALAKKWPGAVVGTSPAGKIDYNDFAPSGQGTLVVMGNEQAGMTDAVTEACTHVLSIPIFGKADSLNISVAAGIVLYALRAAAHPKKP